jgi:hypothetical protein
VTVSWDYKPQAQRLEPVTLAPPLWTLTKNGHTAAARVRAIDGVGLELRCGWDGDLRASQVFKSWDALGGGGGCEARRPQGARLEAARLVKSQHLTANLTA